MREHTCLGCRASVWHIKIITAGPYIKLRGDHCIDSVLHPQHRPRKSKMADSAEPIARSVGHPPPNGTV